MIDPRAWSADAWAAIAAIAAAVAAISSVAWQRRATLQSASPELMLEGFDTDGSTGTRFVTATHVRNVGTGVANHIRFEVPEARGGAFPLGGGELVALLPAGAAALVKFEIMTKEPTPTDGLALGEVTAVIICEDVLGWRHEFPFIFLITESDVGLTESVAPGLKLAARRHWVVSPLRAWVEHHLPTLVRPPKQRRYLNPAA